MQIHPKYRADIDGLRAVAVLSVIIFHAFPHLIPGGFVGVDIFFVISGYLISTIICVNIEVKNFSFIDFYSRRIRRIFPALLLVLSSCWIFGWFSLLSNEYEQLGGMIAGGAGFIANFLLWSQSGYFDNAASTKPLLHLWSLGIEEQFYLVWPVLLWFAWKKRLNLLALTISLALISFGFNFFVTYSDATAAFYSPATRAWELILGAVLAHAVLHREKMSTLYSRLLGQSGEYFRDALSLTGVVFIAAAMFCFDKTSFFPGWRALVPVLGTAMIIGAGPDAWLNRIILNRSILVFIGLISYPLYLWHWPIFSYAQILAGKEPELIVRLYALLLTAVLSVLTYFIFEMRIRKGSQTTTYVLASLMVAIGLLGYVTYYCGGFEYRAKDYERISAAIKDWDYPSNMAKSMYRGRVINQMMINGKETTLFVGDSNIEQYYPRVKELYASGAKGLNNVIFSTIGGCPLISEIYMLPDCDGMLNRGFELAKERDDVTRIVLGSAWYSYLGYVRMFSDKNGMKYPISQGSEGFRLAMKSLENYIVQLSSLNKTIYIILGIPHDAVLDPRNMIDRSIKRFPRMLDTKISRVEVAEQKKLYSFIDEEIIRIATAHDVIVIDPKVKLCNSVICEVEDKSGNPVFKDEWHLRASYVSKNALYIDQTVLNTGP